jgi:hypothetical protein
MHDDQAVEVQTAMVDQFRSIADAMGIQCGAWCAVGEYISQTLWGVSEERARAAVARWGCGVAQPEAQYLAAAKARRSRSQVEA